MMIADGLRMHRTKLSAAWPVVVVVLLVVVVEVVEVLDVYFTSIMDITRFAHGLACCMVPSFACTGNPSLKRREFGF